LIGRALAATTDWLSEKFSDFSNRTGRLTTVCQRSDYRFLVAEQSERREKDEDSTGIHEAFKD
jgi:hypothetical protein